MLKSLLARRTLHRPDRRSKHSLMEQDKFAGHFDPKLPFFLQ